MWRRKVTSGREPSSQDSHMMIHPAQANRRGYYFRLCVWCPETYLGLGPTTLDRYRGYLTSLLSDFTSFSSKY